MRKLKHRQRKSPGPTPGYLTLNDGAEIQTQFSCASTDIPLEYTPTRGIPVWAQPCQNTFTQPGTQIRGHKSWLQHKWTWGEWFYRLRSVTNRKLKIRQMVMIMVYQTWKFLLSKRLKVTSLILTANLRGSVAGTTTPLISDLGKLR